MSRKIFNLYFDGILKGQKFAFNSARRELPKLIKEFASVGDIWDMIEETQEKDGPNRIATKIVWKRVSDGLEVVTEARLS